MSREHEAVDAAITAARADGYATRSPSTDTMGWQPIETAPKDEVIDLWVVFPAIGDEPGKSLRWADSYWKVEHNDWKRAGGFRLGQFLARPYATHWMPRPDAPAHSTRRLP